MKLLELPSLSYSANTFTVLESLSDDAIGCTIGTSFRTAATVVVEIGGRCAATLFVKVVEVAFGVNDTTGEEGKNNRESVGGA